MRTVLIDKTEIQVRGLTAPEIEQLKKEEIKSRGIKGYPLTRFGLDTSKLWTDLDLAEKTMCRIFEMVLKPEDREILEKAPNNKTIETWKAILDETYGNPAEEKNS